MKEIAHFHSTTYHYLQQYPGGMEGLKKDDPDMFLPTFNDLMGNDESMRKMMIDSQSSFIKTSGKVIIFNHAPFIDSTKLISEL